MAERGSSSNRASSPKKSPDDKFVKITFDLGSNICRSEISISLDEEKARSSFFQIALPTGKQYFESQVYLRNYHLVR